MAGFWQRFGKYNASIKQAITNRQVIWLHAVSVGEVNLCTQLIKALEPRLPNVKIIVSTTTTTGMGELESKLPRHITKIYYPIDRWKYVARAFSVLHPEVVVLVEAEIWPNFITRARTLGIPLFLVNARLSDKSYPRYRMFGFLFRPLFAAFEGAGVPNEEGAEKLRQLGCKPEAIHVMGDMKFDAAKIPERRFLNIPGMFRQLGFPDDAQILLGGSTHPGEAAILAKSYLNLKKKFPKLHLVVVPRHFEKAREVGQELQPLGIKYAFRSELTAATNHSNGAIDCMIVNSTGELMYFYEHASVVFVGKSLCVQGGQNPIEPAALSKPIVFGPHMQNFAEITQRFLEKKAAIQVQDAAQLDAAFDQLLSDPAHCEQMGQRAREVVSENLGAIERTVDMILKNFDTSKYYLARK
jgi:3-deoxy-D-manno-octulosonic-acid transferase